jgi:hypothetical protein
MENPTVADQPRCPTGVRCESCAALDPDLAVQVMPVLGETLCLTMCRPCRDSGLLPTILVSTAVKLVRQDAVERWPVR